MRTRSPALLRTETVDWAANRLDPSTSTGTGVRPVTNATSTLLSCSSPAASARVSPGSTTDASKYDGSCFAVATACGPTTAALTLET